MFAIRSVHGNNSYFMEPKHIDPDDLDKELHKNEDGTSYTLWTSCEQTLWHQLVPHDYGLGKYGSNPLFMCGAGLTALAILSKALEIFNLSYTRPELRQILYNMSVMHIIEDAMTVLATSEYHHHSLTEDVHYVQYTGKISYIEKFEPVSKTTSRQKHYGSTMIPLSPEETSLTLESAPMDVLVRWFHSQIIVGVNNYYPGRSGSIYPLDNLRYSDYFVESDDVNYIERAGWSPWTTGDKPGPGHRYLEYVLTEISGVYNRMIRYYPDITLKYWSI
jgi:hypothetical protein